MAFEHSLDSIVPSCLPRTGLLPNIDSDGNECFKEGSIDFGCMDGFGDSYSFKLGAQNSHDSRKGNSESMSGKDIADLLPSDPFGMDGASKFTAILIEDIEKDLGICNLGFGNDGTEIMVENDQFVSGLHLVWNSAIVFHPPELGKVNACENSVKSDMHKEVLGGFKDGSFVFNGLMDGFPSFSTQKYCDSSDVIDVHQGCSATYYDGEGGIPHDAIFYALGHLGVRDLLSVERVCKSLRDAVQTDTLLWRSICIDESLSYKITDDTLSRLTNRSQGTLGCLSLVECLKITDNGLKSVLHSNPQLTKLSIPGCVRLSAEGILQNIKIFNQSMGSPGIKHLRIGGIHGVTNQHFEELNYLLGANNMQCDVFKPRFYAGGHLYLSFDDERALDIETCPSCKQIAQVYDCPVESCPGEHQGMQLCRACTLCISRCINCGRCLNGYDYEETFFLDLLCLDCWAQFLECQQQMHEGASIPEKHSFCHGKADYHLCICG